eukprot:scaffold261439_cov27-Tisochrysis_lutea.AAC.4
MAASLTLAKRPLGLAGCRTLGRASRFSLSQRALSSSRLLEGRYPLNDRPDNRPGLGAVLPNVDLTEDFSEEDMEVIRQASHEAGGILVFPNQNKLDTPKQIQFARKFGIIEPHAVANSTVSNCPECLEIIREPQANVVFGENWHSDNSFMEQTCSYSILRGTDVMPKRGSNDTLFSSTEAAFDALSPTMQNLLYGLKAYHSAGKAYGVKTGRATNTRAAMEATGKMRFNDHAPILKKDFLHPVITVHPDTGRKSIFVSSLSPELSLHSAWRVDLLFICESINPVVSTVPYHATTTPVCNLPPHSSPLGGQTGVAHLHNTHRWHDT